MQKINWFATSFNLRTFPKLYLRILKLHICKMRCRLSEMHGGGGGVGLGSKLFMGEKKNEALPILPIMYYNVSDHHFAALVTGRALGVPDRCQFRKAGGS